MSLIDKIKTAVSPVSQQITEKVSSAVETVKAELPKVPAPLAEAFEETKQKLVSITGKATAYKPEGETFSVRDLARASATGHFHAAPAADASELKESIKNAGDWGGDKNIREKIIDDPSTLKGLSTVEKAAALRRLEEGNVTPGDSHAMRLIVHSCETKEELREVVGRASGHNPPSQPDFHKYDQHLTDEHPCLIADKLNPANTSLPEDGNDLRRQLTDTADAQMKAGDIEGARATLEELKSKPTPKDQKQFIDPNDKGAVLSANPSLSNTEIADAKLKQLDQVKKMGDKVGYPFDPKNPADVKKYFDAISAEGKPTSEIQGEFKQHLDTFYVSANKASWDVKGADALDPAKLNGALKNGNHDLTGRTAIDCEAHTYLTGAIFGKNPRFDVAYASDPGHISAVVVEKGTKNGFSVNSAYPNAVAELNPSRLPKKLPMKDEQLAQIAREHHVGGGTTHSADVRGTKPVEPGAVTADRDLAKVDR